MSCSYSEESDDDDDDFLPLIEVFRMKYKGDKELKPEDQLGTIKVTSEFGLLYIYKVDQVDKFKPSIKYGDDIPVTAQVPIIPSEHRMVLEYDLGCGAYKGRIGFEWSPIFPEDIYLDNAILSSVDETEEISLLLGRFANATVASLKVKFSSLDKSVAAHVYGVVAASNSILDYPSCTSLLFAKDSDNGVKLGKEGVIPLLKSCVGVQRHSVFYVDVSLVVNGVNHTASFSFDIEKKKGSGLSASTKNNSVIEVTVTWDANGDSIISKYDTDHTIWNYDYR